MINTLPVIQSLWIGDVLSDMEKLCIASFLHHGHPFHLYAYNDIQGVPKRAILKDASSIMPPDRIFKYKHFDSYAGFANLFRYKLILEKGGYWVDTDVICLAPFAQEAEHIFASERVRGSRVGYKAANCVFRAPAGSAIIEYCYREAAEKHPDALKWGETGPSLLTFAINTFHMQCAVAHPHVFCPIDWWNWHTSIADAVSPDVLRASRSVHLWNEMWRRNRVSKSDPFPDTSIYAYLKRSYL